MNFLNIAFYRFTPLAEPQAWASTLRELLSPLPIRGTFLLASEGINGFFAGPPEEARKAWQLLSGLEPFAGIRAKESFSPTLPFEKLSIKVKPEIVTFRQPVQATAAPALPPEELLRWYEEGVDFAILDTRNQFEFRAGSFENALSLEIRQFVDLPEALAQLPEEWKGKKILTYCTGGIRCEKAAPYLRSLGYDAYQLEGGILHYFEKVGGRHWKGECFVFDQRVCLGPDLLPTGSFLCSNCQGPVPEASLHCPHCGKEVAS